MSSRQAGVRIDHDLGDEAPTAWREDMRQGLVSGGGFTEAWLYHRPSRSLLLADLIENLEPAKLRPVTAAVMRATLGTRATTGLHVRAALRLGGEGVRDAVRAMLSTEPERVVFAHGTIFARDGAVRLRKAFSWLV